MEYIPGESNLTKQGKKIRYAESIISFAAFTIILLLGPSIVLTVQGALITFLFAFLGFLNFFQAEEGFCGTFGFLGLKDTEKSGFSVEKIEDKEKRKLDILKSYKITMHSLTTGLFLSTWSVLMFIYG